VTWVSVETCLPSMFKNVIVLGKIRKQNVCPQAWEARRFTGLNEFFPIEKEKLWQWLTPTDFRVTSVTHWMVRPVDPAIVKKG